MEIKTERLILRKPKMSDWKDILEGAKELEVSKNLEGVPHPYKKKDAEWFVNDVLKKWRKKKRKSYEFFIELNEEFTKGLYLLEKLNYCYILFHIHKQKKSVRLHIFPPRGNGKEVGLFATRSPNRPNPIGLTVAKIKKIEGTRIYTHGLDILDGSPLLDIKPYIRDFDMKKDSNLGWIKE